MRGVVSVESDTIPGDQSADSSCGNKLTVIFHREHGGDKDGNADSTVYTTPGGARVFASGSHQFSWALDDFAADPDEGHGLADVRIPDLTSLILASPIGDQVLAYWESEVDRLSDDAKKLAIRRYENTLKSIGRAHDEVSAVLDRHLADHHAELQILERATQQVPLVHNLGSVPTNVRSTRRLDMHRTRLLDHNRFLRGEPSMSTVLVSTT